MTSIATLSHVVESLEKYVFDYVWNEPYSEFRTYCVPRLMNKVPASGHFEGEYGTILLPDDFTYTPTKDSEFVSNKEYYISTSVGAYIPAEVTIGAPVPTSPVHYERDDDSGEHWMDRARAKYYVFAVPASMFDSVQMNVLTWTPLSHYCNKNFPDLQLFTRSGIFLNKDKVLIKQSDKRDYMIFAANSDMFDDVVGKFDKLICHDDTVTVVKNLYTPDPAYVGEIQYIPTLFASPFNKVETSLYIPGTQYYYLDSDYGSTLPLYVKLEITSSSDMASKRSLYGAIYTDGTNKEETRVLDPAYFVKTEHQWCFKSDLTYYEDDAIIFGKYHDSDGVADNEIRSFRVSQTVASNLAAVESGATYDLDKATYNLFNGKLLTGDFKDYRRYITTGGYFDSVVDKDVIGQFDVPGRDRVSYIADASGTYQFTREYYYRTLHASGAYVYIHIEINTASEYVSACAKYGALYFKREDIVPDYTNTDNLTKILVHIPSSINKEYYTITPDTCDLWLVPRTLTNGRHPELESIHLYPCGRAKLFTQLTHNDFALDKAYLDELADSIGVKAGEDGNYDYDIRVIVRRHNKKKVFVRDYNYIDMLYNLTDEQIVMFLRGKAPEQTRATNPILLFWKAASLEGSLYADALVRRRNTADNSCQVKGPDGVCVNSQCQRCRLASRCEQYPSAATATTTYIAGCSTYYYLDEATDTWKYVTGIRNQTEFNAARARVSAALHADKVLSTACPYFAARNIKDYVEILGYYHVLGLVGNRVTHLRVTKPGVNKVVVRTPIALSCSDLSVIEFFPIVYHNGLRIDQDRITFGPTIGDNNGLVEIQHDTNELLGNSIIKSVFANKLKITIAPRYEERDDVRFSRLEYWYKYNDLDEKYELLHGISEKDYQEMVDSRGEELDFANNYDYIFGRYVSEFTMREPDEDLGEITADGKFVTGKKYYAIKVTIPTTEQYYITDDEFFDGSTTYYKSVVYGKTSEGQYMTRYEPLIEGTKELVASGNADYFKPYYALTQDKTFKANKLYYERRVIGGVDTYRALPVVTDKSKRFIPTVRDYGEPGQPIPSGVYELYSMRVDACKQIVFYKAIKEIRNKPVLLTEGVEWTADRTIDSWETSMGLKIFCPTGLKYYRQTDICKAGDSICVELLDNRHAGLMKIYEFKTDMEELIIPTATTDQWVLYVVENTTEGTDPVINCAYTTVSREDAGEFNSVKKELAVSTELRGKKLLIVDGPMVVEDNQNVTVTATSTGYLGKGMIPHNDTEYRDPETKLRSKVHYPLDSEYVFLNNKRLIRGFDYATDGYNTSAAHKAGTEVYCQNLSYLRENSKIDCIRSNVTIVSSSHGFLTGNIITWPGDDPHWCTELSTLVVDGRIVSYFTHRFGSVTINEYARDTNGDFIYRNGAPYEIRSAVSTRVQEIIECDEDRIQDDLRVVQLREFFMGNGQTKPDMRSIISHEHKIYSIYVQAIIDDYLSKTFDFFLIGQTTTKKVGSLAAGTLVTETNFEKQFTDYKKFKDRDVVFKMTEYDLDFVDIYPHYHRIKANNREAYAKLHALYQCLLPKTDTIKHKDAPHE